MPVEVWQQIFSTNLFGPGAAHARRCSRRCGRPAAVGSSSSRARAPSAGCPPSAPTRPPRVRLERWGESLAHEIAPFGLGVSVIVTGTFKTDILELTTTWEDTSGPYAPMHLGLRRTGDRIMRIARAPKTFAPAVERALADTVPYPPSRGGPRRPAPRSTGAGCSRDACSSASPKWRSGSPAAAPCRTTPAATPPSHLTSPKPRKPMPDRPTPQHESRMLIDGKLVDGQAGTFDVINPATEQVIGAVADASTADMHQAIDAARRAFDETSWSTDRAFRKQCLRPAAGGPRGRAGGAARGAHRRGRLPPDGDPRPAARPPARRRAPAPDRAHRHVPVGAGPRRRHGLAHRA